MRAVLVDENTGALSIGHFPDPQSPSREEIVVSVKATALNRADLLQRRGLYPPPKGASPILGLEMAGVVEAVGSAVEGWKPGDRVCALLPGGGYAEKVNIPAKMAIKIPDSFSYQQAAAIPEVFLTAFLNLMKLGQAKKNDVVLIHAGASGVGTAAIQLAREIGARPIVTAGTEEKRQLCLSLGAELAIDYKQGDFVPQVLKATEGKGVQVILDFIGASYWEQNIKSLAMDGRLLIIGTMGGNKVSEVDLGEILRKRIHVIGTALRSRAMEDKIELTREFVTFAMPRFIDGRLKPIVDRIFPWEQAEEAHRYMQQNLNRGKIILTVTE